MKLVKVFFTIAMIAVYVALPAQEVKIKGKYKGQKISLTATRTPQGDVVTSLSYELQTKLENEVSELKRQKSSLEKEKKNLESELKKGNRGNCKDVEERLSTCESKLSNAEDRLRTKESELESARKELSEIKIRLDNVKTTNRDTINKLLSEIKQLKIIGNGGGFNGNAIGLSAAFGIDFMSNSQTKSSPWKRDVSAAQQFELTYTWYFSKTKPVALRTGLGMTIARGDVSFVSLNDTLSGLIDMDGDVYDARYIYRNVEEKANVKYLDIPLLLHIGNNYINKSIQGWVDAGFRLSFKVASNIEGSGRYGLKGYYPEWNVEMSDVETLGYVSDANLYSDEQVYSMNVFVLWGQLAAGIYVPLGKSLGLSLGARCGYSLTPISNSSDNANDRIYNKGLYSIVNGGKTRVLIVGAEIGLSYHF